ncbi:MAG: amidohydrolase [Deltaproteobacteria bacterium]|nr:amidohydrolase [Deltaproteobacteria bacterium]
MILNVSREIAPCCAESTMAIPRPALEDDEGAYVPHDLPKITDAHVHLFPDSVFHALWRWFEAHAWPVRYRLETPRVLEFLFSRGVSRVVGLTYAHKPGMARTLNAAMAEVCAREPRVIGLATVYPGEEGVPQILEEAFARGLAGVKLHCHVQCFSPDSPALIPIYESCVRHGVPLVMHAGREPRSLAYRCDPYSLCAVERVEVVLETHPKLRLCVPHLGADEIDGYVRLLERHDNLWLDTTMMLAGFFDLKVPARALSARPDRILYGSDFPNLPYGWDRELRGLRGAGVPETQLPLLLHENARELFRTVLPELPANS